MRMLAIPALLLGACLCVPQALADDNCGDGFTTSNFKRSDLVTIQTQVQAITAALGTPPAPYAKGEEHWQLPTYACQGKNGFRPVNIEYSMSFNTSAAKDSIAQEYKQKMLDARAKGDMQELIKLAREAQQKALQSSAAAESHAPISVEININNADSQTINPLAVLRDGKGFIALKQSSGNSDTETINVYFDKQQLKDADEQASFSEDYNVTVPGRLDMLQARITLSGPAEEVESLVKQLDAGAVLGQLSEKRSKIQDD